MSLRRVKQALLGLGQHSQWGIGHYLILAGALCALAGSARADWFPFIDTNHRLIVIGVAKGESDVLSIVNLTCESDHLTVEVSTQQLGEKENLHYYTGVKVVLSYKTKDGFKRKLGVNGAAKILPGMGLWVAATLSTDDSRTIVTGISSGNRLDVEVVHPELMYDTDVKTIYSMGFTSALLALSDQCPGLRQEPPK